MDEYAKHRAAERAKYQAAERKNPRLTPVLDVLAPKDNRDGTRYPIMEWPKEETPSVAEMIKIAQDILDGIE